MVNYMYKSKAAAKMSAGNGCGDQSFASSYMYSVGYAPTRFQIATGMKIWRSVFVSLLFGLVLLGVGGAVAVEEPSNIHNIRVVPFIHVAKKYFHTRFKASMDTWLSLTPPWADVYLFNLLKEGPAPGPFETILIDTDEYGHNSNVQFFKALEVLYNRYKANYTAPALKNTWYLKLDDDAYVHWPGLLTALNTLTSSLPNNTNPPLYYGNCNCRTGPHVCKHDKFINCTIIDRIAPFDYICGGSGILFNHEMTRMLLDYELSVGCPYSLEDITIGHCVHEISRSRPSQAPVKCVNEPQHFMSLNNLAQVRHYERVRSDPRVLGDVAIWETSYKNEDKDMYELHSFYRPKQQQQQQVQGGGRKKRLR